MDSERIAPASEFVAGDGGADGLTDGDSLAMQRRVATLTITRRAPSPPAEGSEVRADADGDEDGDEYDVSLSSETPVDRWFGREILDHSADAVDLSRAKQGLPLLANHDSARSLPIGRLQNVRTDGEKLRAEMVFYPTAAGRDAKTIVDAGHREMSIGYSIERFDVIEGKGDAPSTYRATRWTPLEGSLVSVPADASIGVGRSATKFPVHVVRSPSPEQGKPVERVTMSEQAAPNGQASRTEAAEIILRAQHHGVPVDQAAEWVREGLTLDQVNAKILDIRSAAPVKQPAAEQLDLSEKDARDYSYTRAILAASEGDRAKRCFEHEVSEALARTLPVTYRYRGGMLVPTSLRGTQFDKTGARSAASREMIEKIMGSIGAMTRTGTIDSVTTNALKEVVFTQYGGEVIPILRNMARVGQMGATFLTGLSSPIAFPRQTGDVTASWVAENSGSDVTASNITDDLVTLSPKTLQALTRYSRQLLVQASADVEALVRMSFAAAHALAYDLAAIHGQGANNQPTGIYNAASVSTVDFSNASFGDGSNHIAFTGVVKMTKLVAGANALLGSLGFMTTPEIAGDGQLTLRFPNAAIAQGGQLWNGTILDGEMAGYRAVSTNQVSKLLGTNGVYSPAGTHHGLIFGNWADLIVAQFGGAMEMIVDPYSKKGQGLIEVASIQMADVAVKHAKSFCVGTNLDPH